MSSSLLEKLWDLGKMWVMPHVDTFLRHLHTHVNTTGHKGMMNSYGYRLFLTNRSMEHRARIASSVKAELTTWPYDMVKLCDKSTLQKASGPQRLLHRSTSEATHHASGWVCGCYLVAASMGWHEPTCMIMGGTSRIPHSACWMTVSHTLCIFIAML